MTRGRFTWEVTDRDRWRLGTWAAIVVATVGLGLALWGFPPYVSVHGPQHYAGIMSPTCGATRAARLTVRGHLTGAWTYNPLGILAVLAAATLLMRASVGWATGHWWHARLRLGRSGRYVLFAVTAVLIALLAIRQQRLAEMLM